MQALILAAGMGQRMGKYTENHTKCMVSVAGKTILERLIDSIKYAGIEKLVMVIGYEAEKLREYIEERDFGLNIEYVYNYDYKTTNNIYSLYLAREYLKREDTILLESDLLFEREIVKGVVSEQQQNMVVVAKYEHWMDGTVVVLDEKKNIMDFISKTDFRYDDAHNYYKTVNIHKFSKEFSENQYIPFLEAYIKAYGVNQYYEQVLKIFAHIHHSELSAYVLQNEKWYEIDDAQDLDIADTMFAEDDRILERYEEHFGGYWRFPRMKDYCYLVNPYYPPKKMIDQMTYFWRELLIQYPSGMNIQKLNAGSMFDIDEEYLLVGNGAAELINVLGKTLQGRLSVCIPTFNEYIRCFTQCEIREIDNAVNGYQYCLQDLLEETEHTDHLLLINPDNPSGSFLHREEVIRLLEVCEEKGVNLILDESFGDFADEEIRYTLLDEAVMKKYSRLIVVKSISKSYGVPGLRLGVIATGNSSLLEEIRKRLAIWNINSFAEYYLQIQRLYKNSYKEACNQIALQRRKLLLLLEEIPDLEIYPSQANYIMCGLKGRLTSTRLATLLVKKHNILIKDLSGKKGFQRKSFIRLAVKNEEDNQVLSSAIKSIILEKQEDTGMENEKRVYGEHVEINQEDVKNLYIHRSKKSETIHVDAPTVLSSDKNPEHIQIWTKREVEHCLPYLKLDKEESVLLELGFGTGRMTRYIAPHVKQYVGIDYVQEFSDIVGHRTDMDFNDRMQFLTMSFQEFLEQRKILNMPEFNRFFVSGGVFMYINDGELEYCMEQLADCLQEKAILYLSEPIAREERLTLKQFYSDAMAEEYSAIYRTDQEYQKLFEVFYQRGFRLKVSEPLFDVDIKGRKETIQWVYVLESE